MGAAAAACHKSCSIFPIWLCGVGGQHSDQLSSELLLVWSRIPCHDIHGFTPFTAAVWDPHRPGNSSSTANVPSITYGVVGKEAVLLSVGLGDQKG